MNLNPDSIRYQRIGQLMGHVTESEKFETMAINDARSLLYLRDLDFSHVTSSKKVLDGCNLKISLGDRLLLQGPSGGGKSTLVSLLTALRKPKADFLLLKGLDEKIWGANRWRKQVVAAPQFHENRILSGTFAFNLLMGRE